MLAKSRRLIEKLRGNPRCHAILAALSSDASLLRFELNNRNYGFFAQLTFCMRAAALAERSGKAVDVALTSVNYRDLGREANWFAYFFDTLHPERSAGTRLLVRDVPCDMPKTILPATLTESRELFFRHFRIREEVIGLLKSYQAELGIGSHSMGVHYRGTDKGSEAALVSYSEAVATIRRTFDDRPALTNIFVASDDANFVDYLVRSFPDQEIRFLADSARSTGKAPIHLGGAREGNYELGLGALMDCLLLSRCGVLIRTASTLSAWSSVFNPSVPVLMMSTPFQDKLWYPETLISQEVMAAKNAVATLKTPA